MMSAILFVVIIIFSFINDDSVISSVFKAAGYTYGPLLGLYTFGLSNKKNINDRYVPYLCILTPLLTYILNLNSEYLLNGYIFGFEIIILNGLLTYLGLFFLSNKRIINNAKLKI